MRVSIQGSYKHIYNVCGDIFVKYEVKRIRCLKYREDVNYSGWSNHCSRPNPVNSADDVENQNKDDDGNTRIDDDADRPGHRAAGVGDTVSEQKKPKGGFGEKGAEGVERQASAFFEGIRHG